MIKSFSTSLIARGILAVIIGVIALAWPTLTELAQVMKFDIYAITLALLFGLFNLIAGTWMLVHGIELRRAGKTLHSVPSPWREKNAA